MERVNLLVSDVDNTLLGDDDALGRFADWHRTARRHLRLAYNSGRFFDSVWQSVRDSGLPEPDAIIGGVGTEICFPPDGRSLDTWPEAGIRWDAEAIRAVLAAHPQLEPQPDHLQSEFKVSFYGYDLTAHIVAGLRRELANAGYDAEVVYSSLRDLDVLPAHTNKGTAVAHLARHWHIPRRRVIVAGDSGNDAEMFRQGFRGIVVGNAHAELKALTSESVYHASAEYAAGVLEGLGHWLPDEPIGLVMTGRSTPGRDADRGRPG